MHESSVLRLRQSRGALRALVSKQLPENFEVQEQPHVFTTPAPLNEVRDEVMKSNPDLQRLRAERQQFDRKLSEEKSLRFPNSPYVLTKILTPTGAANALALP